MKQLLQRRIITPARTQQYLTCVSLVIGLLACTQMGHADDFQETSLESAQLITTINVASDNDPRAEYEQALLKLALEYSSGSPASFKAAPEGMTYTRARSEMLNNALPNFVRSFAFSPDFASNPDIRFVRFPIYLGLLSYRVCFVNSKKVDQIRTTRSLEELKSFRFIQGQDWVDNDILRHNGFSVDEFAGYESLFKMTALARSDIFCRGVNEFREERRIFGALEGLSLDDSFAFYYPQATFFFSHVSNSALLERIEKGLENAYKDGAIFDLWRRYFNDSLIGATLPRRRIYMLENPFFDASLLGVKQYFIRPKGISLITAQGHF